MAAWLAWLKSRLLLPEEARPEEDPELLAAQLTDRLEELARMRAAAAWLGARPQLGRDSFGRGAPESFRVEDRSGIAADLPALLQAYQAARRRALAQRPYQPKPRKLWTVQEALGRLTALVGQLPDWAMLLRFLPEGAMEGGAMEPLERRAAVASTLIAALEAAKGGGIELRQERAFGPILLRQRRPEVTHVRAA
jgi:segregation and condensation protein A